MPLSSFGLLPACFTPIVLQRQDDSVLPQLIVVTGRLARGPYVKHSCLPLWMLRQEAPGSWAEPSFCFAPSWQEATL